MTGSHPADEGDTAPGGSWPYRLAAACRGEGLSSAYQPIVDTARGTIVGYEALMRLDYAERNPEVWLDQARRHGVAADLEAASLRRALEARHRLPLNTFLTVNVSPDLLSTSAIRSVWAGQEWNLDGVVIELTEQTAIESYRALELELDQLRAAGALIAVDDAGSGYSGLQHLLVLRPAIIKLDRGLVQDLDRDEAKFALIEMIGTFADRIDAWLLAEGIERAGELDALVRLHVPLVQGYHLGRPGPPWVHLPLDVEARLLGARPVATNTVRSVLDVPPGVSSPAEAGAHPGYPMVVLVDEHERPITTLEHDQAALGLVSPGMRINLDTPINDALLRALTRDTSSRYDPLLVTDNAGRYVGITRIERLIHSLASTTDA